MKTSIALIFLIVLIQSVTAQQNSTVLKGRIYNESTNEPMPYVNISIPSTATGVTSNEYGEFVYHLPENIENEPVQLSFIGYKTINVNVDTIQPDHIYLFRMQPRIIEIGEVNIVAEKLLSTKKIVKQAIKNISDNFPKESFQMHGYYRDYIRDLNTNDYNNLTEAAVLIEDNGFKTNDYKKTKIKIEQIRYNPGFTSDTVLNQVYDGDTKYIPGASYDDSNDLAFLRLNNPIRNYKIKTFSFVDYFGVSFIQNHNFHFDSVLFNGSSHIYQIKFDTVMYLGLMKNREYRAQGTIHINSNDYAILKFTYQVSRDVPSFSGIFFDLKLEYKEYVGKYYLSYFSLGNYFEYSTQTFGMYRAKIDNLFQYRELFINKIIPEIATLIPDEEAIDKDKMLMSNKVPEIPGFWDNYNFIINEKLMED